ncbi:TRAP transporter small permease [Spirabiliibacterium falconis]|uniref:TRAP transporter small permease n=1 Tax=Spirabiliibacterium falconis TaxID=572023 RepID=UPI001AAE033A|nr:TRAP transporter small permease [Spirabiliibacterium falconis]MBE2895166.1 TRAP transporter small permease [Spirabiliibacterium falconis]
MLLEKVKNSVDRVIAVFAIIVMVMLVVCVTWQVFSRYVLEMPSTVTDEIARFSMIWVGLLGAAYTTGQQRHLSIDLFTHNLTARKKQISAIFINVVIFLFAISTMVYGGSVLVSKVFAMGQISPSMQMPMAYVYVAVPLSGLLIMFYNIIFIIENIGKLSRGEEV